MNERTVVVKGGETLSGIAQREMGNAYAWPQILERNRDTIEAEQKKRGVEWFERYYNPQDWIFPGTELVIPRTPTPEPPQR